MSDEYTPTTEQVLGGYIFDRLEIGGVLVDKSTAEFTRWLEAHDREVAEKAWDEAAEEFTDRTWSSPRGLPVDPPANPYREGAS